MEKPNWLSQMPGEDVPDNHPWTLHGLKMDHLLENLKYAVKMSFQQPRLGALAHQLQLYTCSLLESRGSGIARVLALKLGNTTLIKLGASQWPDCVCSSGRVMTYGDSFPEGTCLIAAHCVVLCANQRQAMVYGLGRLRPPALHPTGLCESQFHLWPEDSQNLRRERAGPHRPSTLIGTSRCNPAQLEQRFQRDKAKGKVAKVQKWTETQLSVFHQTLFLKVDFAARTEPKKKMLQACAPPTSLIACELPTHSEIIQSYLANNSRIYALEWVEWVERVEVVNVSPATIGQIWPVCAMAECESITALVLPKWSRSYTGSTAWAQPKCSDLRTVWSCDDVQSGWRCESGIPRTECGSTAVGLEFSEQFVLFDEIHLKDNWKSVWFLRLLLDPHDLVSLRVQS